jgi:cob(I)alamin adenosyltransferase
MKIYTRTGDGGDTALFGGGRVPKDHPRVEAYGAVDELNALLGWVVTVVSDPESRERLTALQHDLFAVGAELASPPVPDARVGDMERWMDEASATLPELTTFVLPGGSAGAVALHVARTVCRRAERAVVRLAASEPVADGLVAFLNRLGDLCFTMARGENARAGVADVAWKK